METVRDLVKACTNNPFGLSSLDESEYMAVWAAIGGFVRDKMLEGKGVSIPGLGAFGFTAAKVDLGNRFRVQQAPAFFLSEQFSRTHGVRCKKPCPTGSIPEVPLNFAQLGVDLGLSRDAVRAVLKELLVALGDYIHMRKAVELELGVGRLVFRGGSATMQWHAAIVAHVQSANETVHTTAAGASARPATAAAAAGTRRSDAVGAMHSPRSMPASARPASAAVVAIRPPSSSAVAVAAVAAAEPAHIRATAANAVAMESLLRPSSAPRGATPSYTGHLYPTRGGLIPSQTGGLATAAGTGFVRRSIEDTDVDVEEAAESRAQAQRDYKDALSARNAVLARERGLDIKLQKMMVADAKAALTREAAQREERRLEARELALQNRAMAEARKAEVAVVASNERGFDEKPVFGNRPATPPPQMRAAEYQRLLDEQIAYRDARRARAVEDELAFAQVTSALAEAELDRAEREYEADVAAKKAAAAAVLQKQMRLRALQREEEQALEKGGEAERDVVPLRERDSKAGRQEYARRLHNEQMALITARRAATKAQMEADAENERLQLEKLLVEQAAADAQARAEGVAVRRSLETDWEVQCAQKRALAAEEGADIPRTTSLPLQRSTRRRDGKKTIVKRRYRL